MDGGAAAEAAHAQQQNTAFRRTDATLYFMRIACRRMGAAVIDSARKDSVGAT